jgi:hypothetical protein
VITKTPSRDNNEVIQEDLEVGDDDEDDTDSNRPLVFTPSLETPVDTQANTPQDFESMSPAPVEMDEFKREGQVEMVVQGLDQGQAEMEEEMEDHVVKEIEHGHPISDSSTGVLSAESLEASSSSVLSSLPSMTTAVIPPKDEPDLGMDIDGTPATSS